MSEQDLQEMRLLDKGETGRTFNYLEIFSGIENHPENPLAQKDKNENVVDDRDKEDVAQFSKVECY